MGKPEIHSRRVIGDGFSISRADLLQRFAMTIRYSGKFMSLACNEPELKHLLGTVAFTRNFGFLLAGIGDGECTIEVPFQAAFERPGGVVSGQVFMAAADVAMWLAIKTKLGLNDASVTAEMKTNFLGSAKREGFRCTARVLKLGRRLIYGVAECVDANGRLLTHSTITYIRP
jgi:uncharacterized protein (TIGR00369 family)